MDELSTKPEHSAQAHPQVLHVRLAKLEKAFARLQETLERLEHELQALRGDQQLKKAYSRYSADEVRRLRKQVAQLIRRLDALEGKAPIAKAQGGGVLEARPFDALVDEVALEAVRRGAAVADAFAKAGHLRALYATNAAQASRELWAWKEAVEARHPGTPAAARGLGEV